MYTHIKTLRHNRTTPATRLACVVRVHGNNLSTSFFRFVLKHLPEHTQ